MQKKKMKPDPTPAVEKLFKEMLAKEEEAKSQEWESEESVSDEEMTRRYDSLVETVGKKFSKKRKMLSVDAALDALSPSIEKPAKKKKNRIYEAKRLTDKLNGGVVILPLANLATSQFVTKTCSFIEHFLKKFGKVVVANWLVTK